MNYPQRQKHVKEDDVLIAVMGPTGSGKTSFVNLVSGSDQLQVGEGLVPCTSVVQTCDPFFLDGRRVLLVDTPGFDDSNMSDVEVLRMVAAFLATTYEQGKKLSGILYFHRISDYRMSGISKRNFRVFRELCGDTALKNVRIVTNMWGTIEQGLGERREHQLTTDANLFGSVIDAGAKVVRHDKTQKSAENILQSILANHPVPLRIQVDMVDKRLELGDTNAGKILYEDHAKVIEDHKKEIEKIRYEMETANETTKKELIEEIQDRNARIKAASDSMDTLRYNWQAERVRLQQRVQQLEREDRDVFAVIRKLADVVTIVIRGLVR